MKKFSYFILIFLLLCSCHSISIKDKIIFDESADWYFAGGNPEKTNVSKSAKEIAPPLKLLWNNSTEGGYSKCSISICDGIIFTSNLKGDICALDVFSGRSLGSFVSKGKASYSTPVIVKNNIIFTCSGNEKKSVISYDYVSGKINWEKNIGDIYSCPILLNKYIYITTFAGKIFKIDSETGRTKWEFKNDDSGHKPGPFYSGPTAGGNIILSGNTNSILYAVDSASGKLLWKFKTGSQIYSDAAFFDNKIFFGSDDNNFYCINTYGSLIWKKDLKTKYQSSPSFYKDKIIISGIDGFIYALDIKDGSEKWKYETKGSIWASPLVYKNFAFVGSFDSYLYCLNTDNGNLIWKYQLDGRIRTSAVIWNEYLIVACDDKQLYCFK